MDSQYYSSLEEYLIPLDEFLSKRDYYIQKLRLPETGEEFTRQLLDELRELLEYMDQNYDSLKSNAKVSRGSLSFSQIKKKVLPSRIKELTSLISDKMEPVNIIDILVDVDNLIGFLDMFETVGYKEGKTKQEKAERMMFVLNGSAPGAKNR